MNKYIDNPPHNAPIEITIKIDPTAVAGVTQPIARVALSAWRAATSKPAIRIYLILLAIAAVAAGVVVFPQYVVAKALMILAIFVIVILKYRYSPLIPD